MQTLRQALEPVVDRVLETDGWDGEAGGGDGDAVGGRRGEGGVRGKEKCLSDGNLQARWHNGELSTRGAATSFCAARRLTVTGNGEIGDNLWMSYIKKKTIRCKAAARRCAAHKTP